MESVIESPSQSALRCLFPRNVSRELRHSRRDSRQECALHRADSRSLAGCDAPLELFAILPRGQAPETSRQGQPTVLQLAGTVADWSACTLSRRNGK
jgi:hypothetical protein